jgi:UDP-glucose 4-epimerase
MTRYAIIGGAGFIGSHFVDELAKRGQQITVIDNLCSGSISRISEHLGRPFFNFFELDVENTPLLINAIKDIDIVIHLASNPDIAKAVSSPRIDFSQGTALTESVLEACRISKIKKVLYASGSGVYSDSGTKLLDETSLLEPISTYGASKLAGEALLSAYSFMFGISGVAFRFANVVGPRQTHGVAFDFIRKLRNNPNELVVLGNGTQTKSYIHVSDVVSAVLHAASLQDFGFNVYNVATTDAITVREISEIVILEMFSTIAKTNVVFGESDRGWKADVPKIYMDSTKIYGTGWKPKYSSKDAMAAAVRALVSESY